MPSHPQIRDALVARLNTVPGIGRVHGYERFASGEKAMRDLYTSGGRLLGWYVRRVATRSSAPDLDDPGQRIDLHHWEIRGFMGLDDTRATEIAFDALIEAIREAFRLDDTLGGVVESCCTEEAAGIQVEDSGPVMFTGVLCHGCRLSLVTTGFSTS